MSIIDVKKMWSKDGGSITSATADPFGRQYSFTEGYTVLTDAEHDAAYIYENGAAFGLPQIGSAYSGTSNALAKKVDPKILGPRFYVVEVGYEGEDVDSTVEVEWTDTTTTEEIDRDWNGKAIVTDNGEQVTGLSIDVADQICVISRRFFTINTYAIRAYRRSTNSDTFLGWPPGTARFIGYSAKNKFKYGAPTELWSVTARFQFREPYANTTAAQAWYKRWRHEGLLVRESGKIWRARDQAGQEETKPVLLKTGGVRETNPDAAVFKHTQVFGSLPYSALGLI